MIKREDFSLMASQDAGNGEEERGKQIRNRLHKHVPHYYFIQSGNSDSHELAADRTLTADNG